MGNRTPHSDIASIRRRPWNMFALCAPYRNRTGYYSRDRGVSYHPTHGALVSGLRIALSQEDYEPSVLLSYAPEFVPMEGFEPSLYRF